MSTITIKNVSKQFGKVKAIDQLSLTFESNKIYGLLGRNGAGKSTLLNLLSNRIFPDSGSIEIDGEPIVENDQALAKLYCMSDQNLFTDSMKVTDMFAYAQYFYPQFDLEYAQRLAQKFGLQCKKKLKTLSTGYTSIAKLITALASHASIVFFDEPVLGLDAHHRELFYKELLTQYMEHPATYVISTHLIEEAADLIERVVILNNGKLVRDCELEELMQSSYTIRGTCEQVQEYCVGKQVIGRERLGGLQAAYLLGGKPSSMPEGLECSKLDLQKLFICLTEEGGDQNA